MNFKHIIPYVIAGIQLAVPAQNTDAQVQPADCCSITTTKSIKIDASDDLLTLAEIVDMYFWDVYNINYYLNLKAQDLCDQYKNNMLTAQAKIAPYLGKRGYRDAVCQELPGAPVGGHCVYGQCTQLQRAINAVGDTVSIVPQCASRECTQFKTHMRKQYSDARGYENCIFEGRMYETDSAYNAAMNAYMKRYHIVSSGNFMQYAAKFEQNNFSVESIAPGAMLIVPRTRGNRRNFHMITYVGRGRIENNQFIPDKNGRPVYTAHNRERIGYLFDTWDTSNVFAANIKQIARTKYAQELQRIESMPRQQLIKYILTDNIFISAAQLNKMPLNMLKKIARDKYFHKQMPNRQKSNMRMIANRNELIPFNILAQNKKIRTI